MRPSKAGGARDLLDFMPCVGPEALCEGKSDARLKEGQANGQLNRPLSSFAALYGVVWSKWLLKRKEYSRRQKRPMHVATCAACDKALEAGPGCWRACLVLLGEVFWMVLIRLHAAAW